jgi:hypothetical protein
MKLLCRAWWLVLALPLLVGCQKPITGESVAAAADQKAAADKKDDKKSDAEADEKEIKENLAKLNAEDRKLAEAQKYCAVQNDERLGEMDVPVKIMLNGQPVFLCCKSCVKDAKHDPEKTLAKVKELKAKAAKEKPKS